MPRLQKTLTFLQCKGTVLNPLSVLHLQQNIKRHRPGGESRVVFMCRWVFPLPISPSLHFISHLYPTFSLPFILHPSISLSLHLSIPPNSSPFLSSPPSFIYLSPLPRSLSSLSLPSPSLSPLPLYLSPLCLCLCLCLSLSLSSAFISPPLDEKEGS